MALLARPPSSAASEAAAVPPPALDASGISKAFGATPVLHGVNLTVAAGEFVTLLGPSGCGKTTLLRSIAGLVAPDGGSIAVDGRVVFDGGQRIDLPVERRGVGMVFQDYALWPHLSVEQHVLFALELQGIRGPAAATRALDTIAQVRLGGLEKRAPGQLSGGQQQRVALARALAGGTRLLLLDEPLSNLDARLREAMREEIRQLVMATGLTAIAVTHDQADALAMSDRIVVMDQGRIVQVGTPQEVYEAPANTTVARFMSSGAILPCLLTGPGDAADIARYRIADTGISFQAAAAPNGERMAAIVPSTPPPAGEAGPHSQFSGTVRSCRYRGHGYQVGLEIAPSIVLPALSAEPLEPGSPWTWTVPARSIRVVPD